MSISFENKNYLHYNIEKRRSHRHMANLSKNMVHIINEQINAELESAYLYLGMANFYAEKGLIGFAHNFKKQADEEVTHSERLRDYLIDHSAPIVLKDIKAPKETYEDLRAPLKKQLEHEEYVTSLIYKIMDLAIEEKDYRTIEMLRWFVSEQQEEEVNARTLLEEYDAFGSDLSLLYKLNKKLGKRE